MSDYKAWKAGNRSGDSLIHAAPTGVVAVQTESDTKTRLVFAGGGFTIVEAPVAEVYQWWTTGRALTGVVERWAHRLSQRHKPLSADEKREFWGDVCQVSPSEMSE